MKLSTPVQMTVQSIAEGEDWLAAGMLVMDRAISKPHPRYFASAAVDRDMSDIGPRVLPTGEDLAEIKACL
jgi:hypothetical protein